MESTLGSLPTPVASYLQWQDAASLRAAATALLKALPEWQIWKHVVYMRHAIPQDTFTTWSTTDTHTDSSASHLVDLIHEWQNATDMLRDYTDPPTQQALLSWQSLVSTFSFSLQLDDDVNILMATLRQLHTIHDMRNHLQRMNCTLRFDTQETARIPTFVLQHFLSSTDRLSLLWMTMPILYKVASLMTKNTQDLLDQKASTLPQIHSLFARGVQLLQEVRTAKHPSHSAGAIQAISSTILPATERLRHQLFLLAFHWSTPSESAWPKEKQYNLLRLSNQHSIRT